MTAGVGYRGSPIGGDPAEMALRAVEDAVRAAMASHHTPAIPIRPRDVLARVANGLTGQSGGHIERAATTAMAAAFDDVLMTPLDDLKAAESARWAAQVEARAAARTTTPPATDTREDTTP
ncbi:MAG: hypothetical protein F2667_12585 [Actinobacteria bacterium]|uniref:Unannotated protein n=1 Tax=freshwater metagenome TaxID=449393 RepID=A0A6J6RZ24_9ZZZZ|nr:hypothetical protein [Actinomycetota bacterium]